MFGASCRLYALGIPEIAILLVISFRPTRIPRACIAASISGLVTLLLPSSSSSASLCITSSTLGPPKPVFACGAVTLTTGAEVAADGP